MLDSCDGEHKQIPTIVNTTSDLSLVVETVAASVTSVAMTVAEDPV